MPLSLATRIGTVTIPEFSPAWQRDPAHKLASEAFELACRAPGRTRGEPPSPDAITPQQAKAEIDEMLAKLDAFAASATPSQIFPAALAKEALRRVRGAL